MKEGQNDKEFDGKKLKSKTKEGLDIEDKDEKIYEQNDYKKFYEQFGKWLIYYNTGESIAQMSSTFYLETMRKKGLEALYM
eukprot:13509040-Heterocapsa_arctica.AAC.1